MTEFRPQDTATVVEFPVDAEDAAYEHTVAIERAVGLVVRWAAYLTLMAWTWLEPASLGPYIFLGVLIADFLTWGVEVFLAALVWRSRRYSLRSLGGSMFGFALVFALLLLTASFRDPEGGLHWACTECQIAFFFTVCAKTVAISVRRACEITRS
jgi:hypothetical protein